MPAETEITICNAALSMVKRAPIATLDDATESARKCKIFYPKERDALLEEADWYFASVRDTLTEDTEAPEFEFTHQYLVPDRCVKMRETYNYTGSWRHEGTMLLCDLDSSQQQCYVRYTQRVTDVSLMPASFRKCLIYRLAAQLAIVLASNDKMKDFYDKRAEQEMHRAAKANIIADGQRTDENEDTRDDDSSWVNEGR